MSTYYLSSGFIVLIERNTGSLFSGTIYRDETVHERITPGDFTLIFYLKGSHQYRFYFQNASSTDPVKFEIYSYETQDLLYTITFPLNEPLVLNSGIDGESNTDLTINYPLKSFTFANPTKLNLEWYCIPWSPDCGGLQYEAESIDEPKIIGNLSGCSNEDYQGDLSQDIVCDNKISGQYYFFEISSDGNRLYSRLECCCPTVVPTDVPPEPEIGFVCTCPDWGKATSYNQTLFSSSVRLRQWVLSNAGSKADCKHIMAAKRIMRIDQPIYTDPPYSAPPPPATPG